MNDRLWPAAHEPTGPGAMSRRGPVHLTASSTSTSFPTGPLGAESPFFRSKFRIPNDPRHFVPRPRLLSLLDDLADYPVTVIVAPAGAGKTALAADWLRHSGRPCAWLALDAADRDPAQFWRSVMAVLDPLVASLSTGPGEVPAVIRPPAPSATVVNDGWDADAAGTQVTLVIDDLDRLDDDERACEALRTLVGDRPPVVRLVLLSRHRLPLPVDRLRAAGELADITFDALRFTPDEATDLLTGLCPDLPRTELPVVVARAGGWTAALKLAALSLRSRTSATSAPAPLTAGHDKLLDEYLWQEVLRRERPELIRMLLATAVVGRVNYGLAEVLTGRLDAGDLLEEAEERGLFVTSLDDGGWFQVHSLVRDMLLSKYERRWPMGLREQHARAARWFESMDDDLAALDHWHRAERPIEVLRVLADAALRLVDSGRGEVVARVIEEIPPEVVGSGPDSLLRYAWCALMVGRLRFQDALTAAERAVGAADGAADGAAEPRLDLLRAAEASLSGDWDRCELLARPALDRLEGEAHVEPMARFGWTLQALAAAFGERWDDDGVDVGQARVAVSSDADLRVSFEGARVLGLALAGQPLDAVHAAAHLGPVTESGQRPRLRAEVALAAAVVAAEAGDREGAHCTLVELAGQPTYPVPALQLVARLQLVELYVAAGRLDDARDAFTQAETQCDQLLRPASLHPERAAVGSPASWLLSSLSRVGVTLSLATDDQGAANEWSERVADTFWGPVCEAKLHLARGDRERASDVLEQAKPRCVRHEVVHRLVRARATAARDQDCAAATVAVAIQEAAAHGLLQTVAAEGAEILELIELAAWHAPDPWMERLRHYLVPTWQAHVSGPVESLTDRERDVLRLLPSRLTLREIAAQLYVSQNTLKFHLRAIYRKLGVDSRSAAVQTARQMRLLPGG